MQRTVQVKCSSLWDKKISGKHKKIFSMSKDGCVELHSLLRKPVYNGKRGVIVDKKDERFVVQVDGTHERILVKKTNMCVVFCLGLPKECRIIVNVAKVDRDCIAAAVSKVDTTIFHVMYMGSNENMQHFLQVRRPMFAMAMERIAAIDREGLLRVYVANYSQDAPDAKIIFGDKMCNVDAAQPCFADLSQTQAHELALLTQFSNPLDLLANNIEMELTRLGIND